jgi:hypothetical protein
MTFISSFFLRVIPHTSSYSAVSTDEARGRSDSNSLYRTKSERADTALSACRKNQVGLLQYLPLRLESTSLQGL